MKTQKRRWLPIVAGGAGLIVMLGIVAAGVSFVWLREHTTIARDVSSARADDAFGQVARRFADARAAIEIGGDGRPRPAPGATRRNRGEVTTLRVLAWDAREHALADVTLPLWLVRLKSGPIELGGYVAGMADHGVRLTVEEIERMGPGVILDYAMPSGNRVLLSVE